MTDTTTSTVQAFVLWFRASGREKWAIVGKASTFGEAVAMIGIGDRHNGDWMPLVMGKHPNQCGCPDKPLKKPVAMATAELWEDS